jgi:hypothetical protein
MAGPLSSFPVTIHRKSVAITTYILLKYIFQNDEAIERQQHLMIRTIRLAATALGDIHDPDRIITWRDYVELRHESSVYDLEEALYEQAQFAASLAAVDGAVVTSSAAPWDSAA